MMNRCSTKCSLILASGVLLCACSSGRKAETVRSGAYVPRLTLSEETDVPSVPEEKLQQTALTVKDSSGKDLIIMNAVKNENGEMVASDVISTSVVVASFRNVAERHGKVDLRFDVSVPADLIDSRWQLRLRPVMHILGETEPLEPVFITGKRYRDAQLRGYERYERFVQSIISDSTLFVNMNDLEIFIKRNFPQLYSFRNDTTVVSDELWEAVEHYTNHFRKRRNQRRESMKEEKFRRYVKNPIRTEGMRLDTVITTAGGDVTYSYVQTISTRPHLRKVEIELEGSVYSEDRIICGLPAGDKLTFYISSLSSFVDGTERYLKKIVERKVRVDNSCRLDFEKGKYVLREELGDNASEMGRIKKNIRDILEDSKYDLDSVVITAFASPEGSAELNDRLALRRSAAASAFFSAYLAAVADSLGNPGFAERVGFHARNGGENWELLSVLVAKDSVLTPDDRHIYAEAEKLDNPDARERELRKAGCYPYIRENIYPKLRTVKFDFHLHRKGVVRDTVHTSVPDTVYMQGVQAIRDRDYELAVRLLGPYNDYNAALACVSAERNHSAMRILETLDGTAGVHYLMAIVQSRFGNDSSAVRHYIDACREDRSFVFRGSLDPEISAIIKKYRLNLYEN